MEQDGALHNSCFLQSMQILLEKYAGVGTQWEFCREKAVGDGNWEGLE